MKRLRLFVVCLLVWSCIVFHSLGLICEKSSDQHDALMDLFYSTNGNSWRNSSNWGQGDVCSWFGISCTGGRVSFILLPRNNLTGPIPDTINNLSDLRYIDLSNNHLTSTIPPEITCLPDLNILNLSGNLALHGNIPQQIGSMTRLQIFDTSFNNLTGTIPDSLSNCTSLRNFLVQYNNLDGPIPDSFYHLSSLIRLELGYNQITGELSEDFGMLHNLETFQMPRNSLTGNIPTSIGNITGLVELNLEYNQISGTIPEALCYDTTMERLVLGGNLLQGSLPACLSSTLLHLTELDLSRNELSGPIEILDLVKLQLLDLSTNAFKGDLPNLASLSNIQFVDLSANSFSGTLPETLSNNRLQYMRSFDASSNSLSGTLPSWIEFSTDVSLFLTNNEFICPYPENIPLNVHVDTHCVSGIWYQGLFVVVSILLEFIGFIITVVGLTITVAYLYRPSLLESFGSANYEEELNKDRMQNRSDCLLRSRNFLLGFCVLEIQVALLMFLVGVIMSLDSQSKEVYSILFRISVPITAFIFIFKTTILIFFGIRRVQKGLLAVGLQYFVSSASNLFVGKVTVTQLLQLVFVAWALLLEGVAQANALSICVIGIILLDNICNALSIFEAYLIQDQFIPLHQLILDDTLTDSEGAFGDVRHGTYLGIDIAAKRAKPRSTIERKEVYKAFLNEAKILSELGHHSNIVKLIGVSPMLEDEFYIVMEFCDGGTSLNYLRKVKLAQNEQAYLRAVVKLCMGVCDAMHYFHSKGYTHRDITTSNIMVKRGRAMLGDMGLARRIKKKRTISLNSSKYVPRYNRLFGAPELEQGGEYTKHCDVYCFGIAIWEMIMLKKWTIKDLQKGMANRLAALSATQPIFATIVSRCWHEEPSFRPTFAELLEEFSRLNHQEWSSYRTIAIVKGKSECKIKSIY